MTTNCYIIITTGINFAAFCNIKSYMYLKINHFDKTYSSASSALLSVSSNSVSSTEILAAILMNYNVTIRTNINDI